MTTLSLVILQCGLFDLTRTALQSVTESDLRPDEILIVDNGSPEKVPDTWALPREARYILLPANLGYVRGTNAGWEAAEGDYIALCNNDIALSRSCLRRLVEAMESDPALGWVSACYQNGSFPAATVEVPAEIVRALDESEGRERRAFNQWAGDLPAMPPDYVKVTEATVFLVRREMSDAIGMFWADLVYHHSHDYGIRMLHTGWKLAYARNAVFWHSLYHPTIQRVTGGREAFEAAQDLSTLLMDNRYGPGWR